MCDSRSVYNMCLRLYSATEQEHRTGKHSSAQHSEPQSRLPKVKSAVAKPPAAPAAPAAGKAGSAVVYEEFKLGNMPRPGGAGAGEEMAAARRATGVQFRDAVFDPIVKPKAAPLTPVHPKPQPATAVKRGVVTAAPAPTPAPVQEQTPQDEQGEDMLLHPPVSPIALTEKNSSWRPHMRLLKLQAFGKGIPHRKLPRPALANDDAARLDVAEFNDDLQLFRRQHRVCELQDLLDMFPEHDEHVVASVWEFHDGKLGSCVDALTAMFPQQQEPVTRTPFEGTSNPMAWPALSVGAALRARAGSAASVAAATTSDYKSAVLRGDDDYVFVEHEKRRSSVQRTPPSPLQTSTKRRRKVEVQEALWPGDAFAEEYFTFKSNAATTRDRKYDLTWKSKREQARHLARVQRRAEQRETQNAPW